MGCKIFALIWGVLLFQVHSNAQQADSSQHIDLSEVIVSDSGNNDVQFNYYKQSKLPTSEEMLARMSGVTMIRRGNYGMEPALRAYTSEQINLTINGMKIFGACTDKMDPPTIYIEPNNLASIAVTQGAAGAKYGSTLGGSIDMQMKNPEITPQRKIYFTAASTYSSVNNGYNGNISFTSSGPKVAFILNAVYRKAFDYKEGGGITVANSGYEKTNYSGAVIFTLGKSKWLKLDYIGDLGWNIGYPALPMDAEKARANIASASYVSEPGKRILKRFETKVYFNHIFHEMGTTQRPETPMVMDMPGQSYTCGVYSDLNMVVGKNNYVELRGDYYTNYSKASMTMFPVNAPLMYTLTLPDNMRQFVAAYVNDEWHIRPKHTLTFNVKAEFMHAALLNDAGKEQWNIFTDKSTTNNKLLPSTSLRYSWQCLRQLSFNLTAAYGTNTLSANQMYGYYLFSALDNYDYIGNPALKTEKALQGEATVLYTGKIVSMNVTGYYHRLYDFIIGRVVNGYYPLTVGAAGVKQYSNISGAFVTGADATAGITLRQGIQAMNTLTYSYGTLSDGNAVPMLSPLRGLHSVRYTFKHWHIQTETEWALNKNRINTSVGEIATQGYGLLNLRTGYQLMLQEHVVSLDLSVENVLDKQYREYSDWGTILRPGRSFIVHVAYAFGK